MVHSITLQTSDSDISDGDILGQIGFAAPVEGTGSDANLLAASIFARSEGDFSSSNNATELVFATSATESSKPTTSNGDMVLSSTGTVTLLGGLVIADGANIGSSSDTDAIAISSGGVVTMNQIPVFSAGINVSGGTIAGTLATAAQGNVTSLGTLTTLTVDNVIIDGTTIGHTSDTDLITLTSGVVTVAGELDATSLDISGNADIDGTLEADAITVDGVALATYIRDTVGTNMLSSNTESGITVTYDTSNDNIDFAIDAAQTGITSLLAADIKIGEDDQTKIDFETADEIHFYAANVEQVYLADNIFGPQSDSDVDLGTTGVRWKDAFVDSITVTGEIDGDSLDIEGDADINGTLEADAITVGGTNIVTGGLISSLAATVISGLTEVTSADADYLLLWDADDSALKKVDAGEFRSSGGGSGDITGVTLAGDSGSAADTSGNADLTVAGGNGITTSGSSTTLTVALDAALTTVTSLLATDIKIGEDDQTKIDFETADEIHFYAANVEQVYLADNVFGPQSDSDVDLGTTGVRWKDAYIDTITTTGDVDVLGNIELGHASDTTIARASSGQITVEGTAVILAGAVTGITSLLATDIKIGEDDQTKIDFETANEIHFYANNTEQVYLADNIFGPQSDSDVDLGTTGVRWKDAYIDTITTTGTITAGGIVTGTGFTAGSAVLAEAELELLDGLTAGTAIASKVVTTDANIDTTGQRNLTISGELDAATLDISGNADIDGTTNLDAVDIDGNVDLDGTLTIGAAQDGYDFKVFGNGGDAADSPPQSPDKYFMWDESADGVRLRGNFVQEAVPYSNTGTTVSDDSGATINIDWQKGNYHWIVLAAYVTKIIFLNMKRGGRYILRIEQHSSSPKTVSWGNVDYDESNGAYTEVRWVGGTAPTMTNTAGRVDVYGFLGTRSNGRGMDGFVIAQNVAEDGTH